MERNKTKKKNKDILCSTYPCLTLDYSQFKQIIDLEKSSLDLRTSVIPSLEEAFTCRSSSHTKSKLIDFLEEF